MSRNAFQKFIKQEDSGARKKEKIRQEKKKIRKETNEYFAQKKKQSRSYTPPVENTSRNRSGSSNVSPASKTQHKKPEDHKAAVSVGKESAAILPNNTNTHPVSTSSDPMPLNKFIAHAGVCSRRDAAGIVKEGKVKVNGRIILEPGFKVTMKDDIQVNGKKIVVRRHFVYILLNKPKDFITTTEDPQGRKTVLDLVKPATTERVYPIGRLDRNTTGVLLLTNDGELAQKLSHPSYEVRKIYEVKLDRPLVKKDFDLVLDGITLEDGLIAPDSLAYADPKDKSVIGIEIHSGRNRIVRRIFEKLGYDVRNLDRVMYADLTKKNVERGKWRFLTEKEVRLLKFMNRSYTKSLPDQNKLPVIKTSTDILFENNDLVIVNKPAGLLSIPDREGKEISLKIILQEKYGNIFTVHRLDKNTSGVIVFAKTAETHAFLSKSFEDRTIEKIYVGFVNGSLPDKKKTIDMPLMQHPSKNGVMVINKKGKPSITEYEVLEDFGKYSFVQFLIQTGRTHQIRVHMQFIGNPVICDEFYGDPRPILLSSIKKNYKLSRYDDDEKPMLNRLGLHSSRIRFTDINGSSIEQEAELPKDMKALLQQLRKWRK